MSQSPQSLQACYFATAFIHSVKIDRGVTFKSRVLWKRKDNKVQTQAIQNINGITYFDQPLVLPLTFVYDKRNKRYLEKKTDFYVVVIAESGLKSGGSVRYDVSKVLNEKLSGQKMKIQLLKCPDETGYIEISFMFEKSEVPFENQSELSLSSIVENTSIVLQQNTRPSIELSQTQSNQQNDKKSFMKNKNNSTIKQSASKIKKSTIQNQNKQNNPSQIHLKQKIKHLESTIKQASFQISKRDKQISQLRQTPTPSTIDYKALYEQQRKKNIALENKLFQYQSLCISRVQQTVINNLKDQLCEVKFNIGKIINTADDIGGSNLVSSLYSSIGIKEIETKENNQNALENGQLIK